MMRFTAAVVAAGLILTSCSDSEEDAPPSGQVVARVAGQEITASELRLEMPPASSDRGLAAAAQQQALQSLIARKLLVAEAKKRELDNSPMAAMVRNRAEDAALVQLLQMSIASGVPKVSDDEVSEFIDSHPAIFGRRTLISVDQLIVPAVEQRHVQQMEPLNTLDEIEQLLTRSKVRFVHSAAVLDALNLDPAAAESIAGMSPGDVLVSPSPEGGVIVSRIGSSRLAPLTGSEAQQAARLMLTRQRNADQVRRAMEEIVAQNRSQVQINPAYRARPEAQQGSGARAPARAPAAAEGGET